MEIIGTNGISEEEQKNKKIMKIIIITIIILLIISIILGVLITKLQGQLFKFYVDDVKVAEQPDLFVYEGNKVYVSLQDISTIIGYKYYNGGYKQYSEDNTKCYLENEEEVCTFEQNSSKIYKTPVSTLDYQYFTIETPIKKINNKLYVESQGLSIACNIKISYSQVENKITIYTLPYLVKYYTSNYQYAAINQGFQNQKAMLYDLIITQDVSNVGQENNSNNANLYGIYSLTTQKEIVGTKYKDIQFIESTQEFIVTTEEEKVGIITSEGETKVKPQYDSLKQIDKDLNLYLATNNGKNGVIEKNGKILIYLEYEQIGVDVTNFQSNDIKNPYILFNNAIPVKQNEKWGMYDIKGNIILPIEYKGIGCVATSNSVKTLNSILIIPDIKGIVVSKEFELQKDKKITLYGIVNLYGKEIVEMALETVYSITNNGRDEYTMVNNGNSLNVIEYVNKYKNLEELNQENNTNTNTNTNSNEIVTNVQSNQINTNIQNTVNSII